MTEGTIGIDFLIIIATHPRKLKRTHPEPRAHRRRAPSCWSACGKARANRHATHDATRATKIDIIFISSILIARPIMTLPDGDIETARSILSKSRAGRTIPLVLLCMRRVPPCGGLRRERSSSFSCATELVRLSESNGARVEAHETEVRDARIAIDYIKIMIKIIGNMTRWKNDRRLGGVETSEIKIGRNGNAPPGEEGGGEVRADNQEDETRRPLKRGELRVPPPHRKRMRPRPAVLPLESE